MLRKLKIFIFTLLLILPLTGCQQMNAKWQFSRKANNFLEKLEQCETFTFNVDTEQISSDFRYSSNNSYRVLKEPMIVEEILDASKFKKTTGYIQLEGKTYLYSYNGGLNLEEVKDESLVDFDVPEIRVSNNYDVKIKKKGNTFSFTLTLQDFMGEEKALEFFEYFDHISRNEFLNTPADIETTINKDSFITAAKFKIKAGNKTTLFNVKTSIYLEKLEKINFFFYTYFFPKPISPNMEQINVNDNIIFNDSSIIVKAKLTPGSYRIINSHNEPLNTFVYKSTLSPTKYTSAVINIYGSNYFLYNLLSGHFTIEEEGEYYICIYSSSSETIAKLIKNNYETVLNFYDEKEFKSGSVTLEGLYDYDYFVYKPSKQNEILEIKNTGTTPITFHLNKLLVYIDTDKSSYFSITDPINHVFFRSNSDENSSITYSFEVISHQDENGLQENYEDLDLLTSEYTQNSYFISENLPPKKLRLEIEEDGTYKIESLEKNNCFVNIVNHDTKEKIQKNNGAYKLSAGKYEVIITSNNTGVEACKFKCVKL